MSVMGDFPRIKIVTNQICHYYVIKIRILILMDHDVGLVLNIGLIPRLGD